MRRILYHWSLLLFIFNLTNLRKVMNLSLDSILVNSSATYCLVGIYWTSTFPSAYFSQTKWCCIAICFVQEWNYGFLAKTIALWLFPKITIVVGSSSSLRKWERSDCNQIVSLIAWVCTTFSALQEDKKTMSCFFEDQLIAPLLILNKNPKVELQVSISPA